MSLEEKDSFPRLAGLAIGTLTLLLPTALVFLLHPANSEGATLFLEVAGIPFLVTSAVLAVGVGLRSSVYARFAQVSKLTWYRPPLEAFISGFLLMFLQFWYAALNVAFASGKVTDDAALWSFTEWLQYAGLTVIGGVMVGFFCSLYGLLVVILIRATASPSLGSAA